MAIPLYCVALILGYSATRLVTIFFYGQSGGVYDHYFSTFFIPADAVRSFIVAIAMVIIIMLVHTYYGFTPEGGPSASGKRSVAPFGHR